MSANLISITDEALHLPVEARIALVDELLKSLKTETNSHVDALWLSEVEKRMQELDSGMVQALDGESVFADIRQRLIAAA
ncbi:MAG: addiction module protein [Halothiobacillaceae bacterium]